MTDGPSPMPAVTLPPLAGALGNLWDLVLDLTERLPPTGWVLVGGQMVMLHGMAARRVATRASEDVDVLADLLSDEAGLVRCVRAVRELHLEPRTDSDGSLYRFVRDSDNVRADVLAPDQMPPRRRLRAVGGDTIRIAGGTQALQRATQLQVTTGVRSGSTGTGPGVLPSCS